jgi:flagellar FliJ protein
VSARFRLATLERLRGTALETRGRDLHAARGALGTAVQRRDTLAERLTAAAGPQVGAGSDVLQAAAYREGLRERLRAAGADVAEREAAVVAAGLAWRRARADLRAVTTLHERHQAALRAEQARRDQRELDDLAGSRAASPAEGHSVTPAEGHSVSPAEGRCASPTEGRCVGTRAAGGSHHG